MKKNSSSLMVTNFPKCFFKISDMAYESYFLPVKRTFKMNGINRFIAEPTKYLQVYTLQQGYYHPGTPVIRKNNRTAIR